MEHSPAPTTINPQHKHFFSAGFYNWLFQANPPDSEPLTNGPSISLTFLYLALSLGISLTLFCMARAKLQRIKRFEINTFGSSIFTIRVLVLIQVLMAVFMSINLLFSVLIIVSNSMDDSEQLLEAKKWMTILMSILYQARAIFSYLVVLNIIFEMISLLFLIRMEEDKSMPEILYQANNRGKKYRNFVRKERILNMLFDLLQLYTICVKCIGFYP